MVLDGRPLPDYVHSMHKDGRFRQLPWQRGRPSSEQIEMLDAHGLPSRNPTTFTSGTLHRFHSLRILKGIVLSHTTKSYLTPRHAQGEAFIVPCLNPQQRTLRGLISMDPSTISSFSPFPFPSNCTTISRQHKISLAQDAPPTPRLPLPRSPPPGHRPLIQQQQHHHHHHHHLLIPHPLNKNPHHHPPIPRQIPPQAQTPRPNLRRPPALEQRRLGPAPRLAV